MAQAISEMAKRKALRKFVKRRRLPAWTKGIIKRREPKPILPYLGAHSSEPHAILMKALWEKGYPAQAEVSMGGGRAYLGGSVVDVYIPVMKTVARVQGDYWHSNMQAQARDDARAIYLKAEGLRVVDVWERDIYTRLDWVIEQVIGWRR